MSKTTSYMNDNDNMNLLVGFFFCALFAFRVHRQLLPLREQRCLSLMLLWRHPPSEIKNTISQIEEGGLSTVKYLIDKL